MFDCVMSLLLFVIIQNVLFIYADEVMHKRFDRVVQEDTKACRLKYENHAFKPSGKYCPTLYDPIFHTCWPATAANSTQIAPCPKIMFLPGNYTRRCLCNGIWDIVNTLHYCKDLPDEEGYRRYRKFVVERGIATREKLDAIKAVMKHYDIAWQLECVLRYTAMSICFICLCILAWLYPLQNDRINLHRNLILSLMFMELFSILRMNSKVKNYKYPNLCDGVFITSHYFFLMFCCWMFNEACYQLQLLYFVFIPNVKFRYYLMFGYGFPTVITFGVYLPLLIFDPPTFDDVFLKGISTKGLCWVEFAETYRWRLAFDGLAFFFIGVNMVIMVYLLVVIRKKLKQTASPDMTKNWKTVRAFFMLVILLGGILLFNVYAPDSNNNVTELLKTTWVVYLQTVTRSVISLLVCLFYVIFNREVQRKIYKKLKNVNCLRKVARHIRRIKKVDNNSSRIQVNLTGMKHHKDETKDTKKKEDVVLTNLFVLGSFRSNNKGVDMEL